MVTPPPAVTPPTPVVPPTPSIPTPIPATPPPAPTPHEVPADTPKNPPSNNGMESMHATIPLSTAHGAAKPTTQIHGFVAPKKKSPVSAPILILGGVVFLLAYALFWFKFFNVPLPFLPQ